MLQKAHENLQNERKTLKKNTNTQKQDETQYIHIYTQSRGLFNETQQKQRKRQAK